MYHHFWDVGGYGHLGVRLFFVLSGFLITTILLDLKEAPSTLPDKMKIFYARRILRIWPIYYLTLFVAAAWNLDGIGPSITWHLLHVSNIYYMVRGDWVPAVTAHLWSLSVEEQFYLVWPLAIFLTPRRLILPMFIATTALAVGFRAVVAMWDLNPGFNAYVGTPAAFDALGVGALIAWLRRSGVDFSKHRPWLIPVAGAALGGYCLLFVINISWLYVALPDFFFTIVFACLVIGATIGIGGVAGRLLESSPFVYVGKVSYGVYLYHGFVNYAGYYAFEAMGIVLHEGPLRFVIMASLSIAIAALSWHLIERPINSLKRLFPYEKRTGVQKMPARVVGS